MEDKYVQEAEANTLKGIITCGSREGYNGKKEFSLKQIMNVLEKAHSEISSRGLKSIPCILRVGELTTRNQRGDNYKEKVYLLDFLWGPRYPSLTKKIFYQTLVQYVRIIGSSMKQERIYLEFEDKTIVFKRS